jgi:hypothetical protein
MESGADLLQTVWDIKLVLSTAVSLYGIINMSGLSIERGKGLELG